MQKGYYKKIETIIKKFQQPDLNNTGKFKEIDDDASNGCRGNGDSMEVDQIKVEKPANGNKEEKPANGDKDEKPASGDGNNRTNGGSVDIENGVNGSNGESSDKIKEEKVNYNEIYMFCMSCRVQGLKKFHLPEVISFLHLDQEIVFLLLE